MKNKKSFSHYSLSWEAHRLKNNVCLVLSLDRNFSRVGAQLPANSRVPYELFVPSALCSISCWHVSSVFYPWLWWSGWNPTVWSGKSLVFLARGNVHLEVLVHLIKGILNQMLKLFETFGRQFSNQLLELVKYVLLTSRGISVYPNVFTFLIWFEDNQFGRDDDNLDSESQNYHITELQNVWCWKGSLKIIW